MKKLGIVLISTVLAFSGLTGCAKQDDHGLDPDHPITLRLWNYYNGAQKVAFDDLIETFNQTVGKDKGILVEVTSIGSVNNIQSELQNSLDKKVNAMPLPDIFSTYADTAEAMEEQDMLVSLKDYMSDKEMEQYITSYMEEGRLYQNEDIKIFPVAKASEIFVLNKTAWDEFTKQTNADISKLGTWEGLNEIAKQYYEYSGKAFFGRDALMNYLNTGSAQLGNELFSVDGKSATFTASKQTLRKLWDNFYVPYIHGYYTKKGKFASDDFKTSDIIASVSSSAGATFFPKEVVIKDNETQKIEYEVLSIPNFEGCDSYAISQGAGMAIAKSDETREYASVLFLKWMTQPEQNIAFTAASSYLPVTKDANNVETWEKAITDEAIEINDLTKDAIKVSMKQIEDSTIYTSQNFKNSFQARNYLENEFMEIAEKDQQAVEDAMAEGKTLEEAVKLYTSDAYFEAWYAEISESLSQILQGQK